jgi:hypothetical protein
MFIPFIVALVAALVPLAERIQAALEASARAAELRRRAEWAERERLAAEMLAR